MEGRISPDFTPIVVNISLGTPVESWYAHKVFFPHSYSTIESKKEKKRKKNRWKS
jgi:hypothetical protein